MADAPPDPMLAALLVELPRGVRYECAENAGILRWSNWDLPKAWGIFVFLPLFWAIWTPLTLGVTYTVIAGIGPSVFLSIWLIFGWVGVISIPYAISSILWREEIVVEAECVRFFTRCLWLSFEKTYSFQEIHGIWLGDAKEDTDFGLRIVPMESSGRTSVELAYPASLDAKKRIFCELRELLRQRKPGLHSYCQGEKV